MVKKLQARRIAVIVYDPVFSPDSYQWDRIHLTAETHGKIAAELLPQVVEIIKRGATAKPKDLKHKRR
jgi:lysophospholipase L1-like esterase